MNKPVISMFALLASLGCSLVLIWMWQRDPVRTARHVGTKPPQAAIISAKRSPSEAPVVFDDAFQKLLDQLLKILAEKDVRPNETVLTFKDAAALARFVDRAGKEGLTVVGRVDALRAVRVHFDDVGSIRNELAQNAGDYSDLSANYTVNIPQVPAKEDRPAVDQVPFGNDTLAFIGATGDRTQWGRGVTIAVLDTGVAADATFGNGRVSALDIGLGVTPGKGADDGHGTSVASLAAGASADAPGVAPAANLLSIRVTDANGTSDIFTLAQGIVTAVDAGAKIVNISMGGYATNAALEGALSYASQHGVVVVAAAGNDQAAQLAWPAADPRVVSVGAVDRAEQQVSFSNSGSQLQLSAPGYGVQTAWLNGQRVYVDGTSASAPLVAGAIAAVLSQNPSMTTADAAELLTKTANDAGPPGDDPAYGKGILDIGWAMNVNNPNYVDTAISGHYYDAAANQMDFTVQNRSSQAISGLSLGVAAGTTTNSYLVPTLAPGASTVVRVPVDAVQLATMGRIRYVTTLSNPLGITDQVPNNNRRSSVLTAPRK